MDQTPDHSVHGQASGAGAEAPITLALVWPVLLPVVGGLVVTVLFVLAESAGIRPFSHAPMTPSEAAAAGEAHVLVRLLHEGARAEGRYPVGTDLIPGPAPRVLTPIEAAVIRDQGAVARLLEGRMLIEPAERVRLICLARQSGARDTAQMLMRDGLEVSDTACAQARASDQ